MTLVVQMPLALDHRLALCLYAILVLTAVGGVVVAWLRLMPAEREPFAVPGEKAPSKERDAFAIFLLANVTLSVLLRIPGLDSGKFSATLAKWMPEDWANHGVMIAFIWFGFIPGLAAAYSLVRKNPLRWPLVASGVVTLLLWLASPVLLDSIRGTE